MRRIRILNLLLGALWLVPHAPVFCAETEAKESEAKPAVETGSIRGQLLVQGPLPPRQWLIKGNPNWPNVPDETLVIDPQSRGLANAFVYLKSAPKGVKLPPPNVKPLPLQIRGSRYQPHTLIVQVGQPLVVTSFNRRVISFCSYPIHNTPENVLLGKNTDAGLAVTTVFDQAEPMPTRVASDLHNWMTAWLLVLDHPFCAVTNDKGEFAIDGLPAGEHDFRVWQERSGYLEKKLTVKVKDGKVTDLGQMEYDIKAFEE